MEGRNKPKRIQLQHIERGIEKYKGVKDANLNRFIGNAGLSYIAYTFIDGRILLVLPENMGGLLYPNAEAVYAILET